MDKLCYSYIQERASISGDNMVSVKGVYGGKPMKLAVNPKPENQKKMFGLYLEFPRRVPNVSPRVPKVSPRVPEGPRSISEGPLRVHEVYMRVPQVYPGVSEVYPRVH